MRARADQLIGRQAELEAIDRLLGEAGELPGAVVLHGEPGIGKTALWLAGVATAHENGYRVMSSRPAESETRLSYAGLTDLLGGIVDDVLPALPSIQRRALEAALLLGEPDAVADERAVSAAFRSALDLLVADAPLCLAVDDLQWLDAASTAALGFALSRLGEGPLAILLTVRGDPPEWLRRSLTQRPTTFEVVGVSVGALRELLERRLEVTFPRPTLLKLWETSAGNPFFALELAEALKRRGNAPAPGDPLPLPSTLDELLSERLANLDRSAVDVARVVAAVADPTAALVESVLPEAEKALEEALEAGILELDDDHLRFTHPLLATAVTARQTATRRRRLHARLATLVSSTEERSRHLALSTLEPDREIAATLEAAAQSAHARGAPVAAAELAEQALRLTPPVDTEDASRRLLLAAERYYDAGDRARSTGLLEEARVAAAPGTGRAAVLSRLARVTDSVRDAVSLNREALAEAGDDEALQAEIHLSLAPLMRFTDGVERGLEHAELAVRAASRTGDRALRCRALAAYGLLHFNAGRGVPSAEMDEALELERSLGDGPLPDGPMNVHGHQLFWSAEVENARALFSAMKDAARSRNDAGGEAEAQWYLCLVEWRAGNREAARRHADESGELMTQLGMPFPGNVFPAMIVAAHQGPADDARALAQEVAAQAESEGTAVVLSSCNWILGFIELSLSEATSALPHLRRAYEAQSRFILEPGMRLELGDLLETLVATGELDEADDVLALEEPRAATLDRAWALAIFARCRALLHAARGDLDSAFSAFERALAEHARTTDPFHHARTLLALGRTQRRAKRRGDARRTLEDALARFETLGAPLWAEQTHAELARIGGRAPSRGALTEAERRIAGLVAEGRTNREVAAALYLTEHSVETALTRVYRKLGIRSRAELARELAANS
ncbi:MAG TPA: AAA family ATPase [Gaiella sp.]|nr:AAA family ATPase [Gaiella sp.]